MVSVCVGGGGGGALVGCVRPMLRALVRKLGSLELSGGLSERKKGSPLEVRESRVMV